MDSTALNLLSLLSPTPLPAAGVARELGVPLAGDGSLRVLVRRLRQRRWGVRLASGRAEAVQAALPTPPDPLALYVWLDRASWERLQGGLVCRWCGARRSLRQTNTYHYRGRVIRRRVCLSCRRPLFTEERVITVSERDCRGTQTR